LCSFDTDHVFSSSEVDIFLSSLSRPQQYSLAFQEGPMGVVYVIEAVQGMMRHKDGLRLVRLMPPAFLLVRFFFLLRNFFQPVRCIPQNPVHNSTTDVLSLHITLICKCYHLVHEFERPVNVGIARFHGNGFLS
jgi:hypothetical protein